MAVTVYKSLSAFDTALKAIDASAEAFTFFSVQDALDKIASPPVGKVIAKAFGYGNDINLVFATARPIVGLQSVNRKGNYYVIATGTAPPAPTLTGPFTVSTFEDPKSLEDFLVTLDVTATVTTYKDESQVDQTNARAYLVQPGRFTVIRGTLANLVFALTKGGYYTMITR